MIETIEHKKNVYPKFQSNGFAARFAFPFAKEVCKGVGVDIGCNREEWAFPGAKMIDPEIDPKMHATNFPYENLDYIFSSHCLEHLYNWVDVMDYWYDKLKTGVYYFYTYLITRKLIKGHGLIENTKTYLLLQL